MGNREDKLGLNWFEYKNEVDDDDILFMQEMEEEERKRYESDDEDEFLLDAEIDYLKEDYGYIDYDDLNEEDEDYIKDYLEEEKKYNYDYNEIFFNSIDIKNNIDISQINSASHSDFNTPLDYYIDGKWYLQKAICDKFPKETEFCDVKDNVSDIIEEIYSIDKILGIKVWRWIIKCFGSAVKNTDKYVYEDLGNSVYFALMQFEKNYGKNPKNNYLYDCLTTDIDFLDEVIEMMSWFYLEYLIIAFACNNNLELIKRIGLKKLNLEKTAESTRNTFEFLFAIIEGIYKSENKVDKEFIEYIESYLPYLKNKDRIKIESDLEDLIEDERINGIIDIESEENYEDLFSEEEMLILHSMQCAVYNIENGIKFNNGYENSEKKFDFCFYYPESKKDVVSFAILSKYGEVLRLNERQWIGKISASEIEDMLKVAMLTNTLKRYVRFGKYFVTISDEEKTELEINMPIYNWLERYSNIAKLFLLQNHLFNINSGILYCGGTAKKAFELWKNYDLTVTEKANDEYEELKKDGKIFACSIAEMRLFLLTQYLYGDAVHRYTAEWLEDLSLDIYIPSLNTAIEYNGMSYDIMKKAFGEEYTNKTKIRNERKKLLCKKQGVALYVWEGNTPIEISNFNKVVNLNN